MTGTFNQIHQQVMSEVLSVQAVYDPVSLKPQRIEVSSERLNEIRRSLEDAIRETNRVTNGWANQISKSDKSRYHITIDNVKSVFNGYIKKMLRHYLKDDVQVTRFLTWHKITIINDAETLQIVNIGFIPMRENDHPFMPYISAVLKSLDYASLEVKSVNQHKEVNDIIDISFDSIINIKF